jgi:hypothetical protein
MINGLNKCFTFRCRQKKISLNGKKVSMNGNKAGEWQEAAAEWQPNSMLWTIVPYIQHCLTECSAYVWRDK